ncbi:CAP domain-containing protein [Streptomyces sp. NBC_00390]|uniref:CAP domain-containing protein n=1 Tax=Streptomyces sp. NBC_00390 TaxID=2975736 RepID=UPI002E1F1A8E
MRKHRRTTHYRKITITAVALSAVAVPSAAMACWDPQASQENRSAGQWERTSHDGWERSHGEWDRQSSDKRWSQADRDRKPAAPATKAPAEAKKPSAPATKAPAPEAEKPAAPATKPPAEATPSKPSTPAAPAPASGDVARVVQLVNAERSKVGCSPVTVNAKLTKAAEAHSKDMASHSNMSHTGSDGSSPGDRITRAGYTWSTYGENVAYGYDSPESVMAGWMASPGHKENILNCAFKEIGVALAQPNSYWTQDFGTAR